MFNRIRNLIKSIGSEIANGMSYGFNVNALGGGVCIEGILK